jgi:hypothetical protein
MLAKAFVTTPAFWALDYLESLPARSTETLRDHGRRSDISDFRRRVLFHEELSALSQRYAHPQKCLIPDCDTLALVSDKFCPIYTAFLVDNPG